MKKSCVAIYALMGALVLSACGGASMPSGEWIRTERGDVYCLTSTTYGGKDVTDCNWNDAAPEGSRADSALREGKWLTLEDGREVYCLTSTTYGGKDVTDCDWSTLKDN